MVKTLLMSLDETSHQRAQHPSVERTHIQVPTGLIIMGSKLDTVPDM